MTYYGVGIDTDWLMSIANKPESVKFKERINRLKGVVGIARKAFHKYTVLLFETRFEAECARFHLLREGYNIYGVILKLLGDEFKNDY